MTYLLGTLLLLLSLPIPDATGADFTDLNIEQLMQIEVTSAAKKPQRISQTATAIYVISSEDIRRSGVTSIPEALRMAPGVQVAHIDHNKWAIGIRGLSNMFSDKLLVLMDGRTLYNTLFSGVWWDVQDTLMEDIDRIEIIRGPGATLWGANAVNGVINIITKAAQETQNLLATATLGSEERVISGLRYGGPLGDKGSYRVYAKYFTQDEFVDADGDDAWDDGDMLRCGFRADLTATKHYNLTLQGDFYDGKFGTRTTAPIFTPPYSRTSDEEEEVDGGNLLARYNYQFSNSSELTFQTYYDLTNRKLFIGKQREETIDLDLQHLFSLGQRQEIIWGLGYRRIDHDASLSDQTIATFGDRKMSLFSGFLQGETSLIPEQLTLILGSKCEYNDFTGFEIQPSARILWTPNQTTSLWAAVSRAVRTPHRGNHDTTIIRTILPPNQTSPLPTVIQYIGDDAFDSEELLAFETGFRMQLQKNLNVDLTLFYNRYDDLAGLTEPSISMIFPTVTVSVSPNNNQDAVTYGAELVVDWIPFEWWRLQFTGSCIDIDFDPYNEDEERTPEYQFSLRSMVDLPYDLEFDCWLRQVDEIPVSDISSYTQLDLRLGWQPLENLELALIGQNLLDRHQAEFVDNIFYFENSEVERSFYLKATLEF